MATSMADVQASEEAAMRRLADNFQERFGISDEQIDSQNFGLFDHVTGRALVAGTRSK